MISQPLGRSAFTFKLKKYQLRLPFIPYKLKEVHTSFLENKRSSLGPRDIFSHLHTSYNWFDHHDCCFLSPFERVFLSTQFTHLTRCLHWWGLLVFMPNVVRLGNSGRLVLFICSTKSLSNLLPSIPLLQYSTVC